MPYDRSLDPIFDAAGQQYNVDPDLLRAVHLTETGGTGRWDQVNPKSGASGGMQFMPTTAAQYEVKDPFKPEQAIPGAARLLSDLLGTYEKQVGAGPEAVTMALRGYNAGNPTRWSNPETAAYPGAVARYYTQIAGKGKPMIGADNPAAPDDGLIRLRDAGGVYQMPRTEYLDMKANGYAMPGVPEPTGQPTSPQIGLSRLAQAGASPAMRVAQDVPSAGLSDTQLLQKWIDTGKFDLLEPPPQSATAQTPAAPSAVAAPASAMSAAPPSGATPVMDVHRLLDTYNKYRSFPAGVGLATNALGMIQKMTPEGYQLMVDPAQGNIPGAAKLIPTPGGPADPAQANRLKANEAAGSGLMQPDGAGGFQNIPGTVNASAERSGAVTEAQEGPKRTTQAVAPRETRGSGSMINYPPGSPGAQLYIDAQKQGLALPPGVNITDSGAVEVGNVNVPAETVTQRYKQLGELQAEAEQARLGKYEALQLKQKLADIGTSGPMTDYLGKLSAIAQQVGVPPETIKAASLPAGATVQEANKLSTDLLGAILHQTFPQRITNTDITAWKDTVPRATSLQEANNYLIDKIVIPKFQRAIDRYGFATTLPAGDPQLSTYYKSLNDWDNANPFDAYQIAKEFKPASASAGQQPDRAAIEAEMKRRGLLK